jgi:hypothetical protein
MVSAINGNSGCSSRDIDSSAVRRTLRPVFADSSPNAGRDLLMPTYWDLDDKAERNTIGEFQYDKGPAPTVIPLKPLAFRYSNY